MDTNHIISDLIKTCHLIQKKGMVSGSGGNVSIRVADSIYITPSGRSLESLVADDIVILNYDGSFVSNNNGIPSKEWKLHLACYKRSDVNAVVHVHSSYAVVISCLSNLDMSCAIPVYTPGYGLRVGNLPSIPYYKPGSDGLYEEVGKTISYRNSVLLMNHGLVTVGKNLEMALNIAEEIEEEAHLHIISNGKASPLPEEEIAILYPNGLKN